MTRPAGGGPAPAALQRYLCAPAPLLLRCGTRPYDWGDAVFIPRLLGLEAPSDKPCAELWLGAHPDLPSRAVLEGAEIPLDRLIEAAPEALLGAAAARRFGGRLPFLLKVLAVAKPLSVQVHPTKAQAQEGFARGLAGGRPDPNYKDDNHKPELIAALTDFYGLMGFRPLEEVANLPSEVPELAGLLGGFHASPAGLQALYSALMDMHVTPPDVSARALAALGGRLEREDAARPFGKERREHWFLRARACFGPEDRGLYAIYLFNLVHLKPGQAAYVAPGMPHSYLEGAGVEVMANSDNVLRGGLTSKRVDVPAFLGSLSFEGGRFPVTEPASEGEERVYRVPASEFELRRLRLAPGRRHALGLGRGPSVTMVLEAGAPITVEGDGVALEVGRGGAFFAPHGAAYALRSAGECLLYEACVPGAR